MANMIITSNGQSIDIAPALLQYNRNLKTDYYYDVQTMDGKNHKKIRCQHEELSVTLGSDKYFGNSKILNTAFNLITYAQQNDEDITMTIEGINVGTVSIEIDGMQVERVDKNKTFVYDMLSLKITIDENGVIQL